MSIDNRNEAEIVLGRLKKAGVDISSFYDVVVALERENNHYRKVIQEMERKLRTQKVRPRRKVRCDFECTDRFGLMELLRYINESGSRVIAVSQDNDDYTVFFEVEQVG